MSRIGYLILCILLIGLGTYVYWPEKPEEPLLHIWTKEPPQNYRVVHGDMEQTISGDVVRIKGIERPIDAQSHQRLWSMLARVAWNPAKSLSGIHEDQLSEYGIDGSKIISCDGLDIRWGVSKNIGYVWDGVLGRIFISDEWFCSRLTALSERMDELLALQVSPFTRITIDNLTVALAQGQSAGEQPRWHDTVQPQRPDFNMRVNKLYDLIENLRINDLTIPPLRLVKPVHALHFATNDPTAREHDLRLWTREEELLVQVDDQPIQRFEGQRAKIWMDVIEMFEHDYLFNLYEEFARQPLAEVQVSSSGEQRFRLEKHGIQDVAEGRSQWDIVWSGGREPASAEAAPLIAFTLDKLTVREPRKRLPEDNPSASALIVTFIFQQDRRVMTVAIDNDLIFSPTHVAKAVNMPELLQNLTADRMLDPALTFRGAERVVKVQRQWHRGPQAGRAEVFAVQGGAGNSDGVWMQSWPEDDKGHTVSTVAIDQVIRALCTAQGHDVRLYDADDRAAVQNPDFELDVRFAPMRVRLSNDHSRLVDTNDQDLGFAFVQQPGRGWRAIDKEGGVSYGVTEELMELLQAPLIENLVLPVIPSLVSRLDLYNAKERLRLSLKDDGWQLQIIGANGVQDGEPVAADVIAVRRHLRLLAGLRANRIDPQAGPFSPGELYGTAVCVFPGADKGNTRVTLSVGPTVDGETAVVVEGGAGMRGLPRGRVYVAADQMEQVFPGSKRFVVDAQIKSDIDKSPNALPINEAPQ